jgi:RHS repeat-associated protein
MRVGTFVVGRILGRRHMLAGLCVSLVAILALTLLPASASAEALCTDTWTGPSEGNWATESDWSTGERPTSTSVVCIGSGKTVNVTSGGFHTGVVQGQGTLVTGPGGTLEVANTLEPSTIADLSVTGGELVGPAEVDVTHAFSASGGALSGLVSVVIGKEATGDVTGGLDLAGGTLENAGTLSVGAEGEESADAEGKDHGVLINSGTMIVNTQNQAFAFSPEAILVNTGTLTKTKGTWTTRVGMPIDNEGAVTAAAGKLEFFGGGPAPEHTSGSWSATATGTDIIFGNTQAFSLGSVAKWEGNIEVTGRAVDAGRIEAATTNVTLDDQTSSHATIETTESATSTIENLTLEGPSEAQSDTLVLGGVLDVTSSLSGGGNATISGAAPLVLESGATGTITTPLFISGGTFKNAGTLKIGDTESFAIVEAFHHGVLDNSGTLIANTEGEAFPFELEEEARLVNTGTLKKTEGTWTTVLGMPLENLGSIRAEVGKFEILAPVIARARETEYGGPGGPSTPPGQLHPTCGEPVSCATGNFFESQTDLAVGGRGIGLDLTRSYNSQAAAAGTHGPFGYGWSSSFSDHLVVEKASKLATLHQAEGSAIPFAEGAGGVFAAPGWTQDTLTGTAEAGYTLTLSDQTKYKFAGSTGRLESVTDRDGNATTLSYTSEGRLEAITDPDGRKITLAYNSEGLVESAKDPMGHVVKYTYEAGNLASVTLPGESSARWQFKYNGSHELTEMIDGRGGKTLNEYNGSNQVTSQTDPAKHTLRFEYAPFQTTITNESTGAVTLEQFTSNDEPFAITHGYGTSLATTQTFTYNEAGYVASETDGDRHTTRYGYDSEGDRTSTIDPDEHETKWTYDSTHDVETTTTPDGETTTIKRESHGNPETISRPAPGGTQTTTYKYNAEGELTSLENPLKQTWKYEYDAAGDRTSETDPEGDKRTWKYNEDSQEISTVSPRGHASGAKESSFTTTTERDLQGRQIKVTDPLGHETKYAYDANGNLETETDPEGNKTTYSYNADNQQIKVQESNGDTTETEYDGAGQVISQTDGNKHATKYTRNVLEEVTEVTDPLGRTTTKEYDKAGNLTSLTDAEKRTTTYKYDPDDRLVEVTYSDGKTPTVKYEYNGDGDRTKMVDGTGESTYKYDELDRLTETEDGHGDKTGYEYNLGNEQTKITYPNGKAVTRAYDADGRLKSVTDWLEHTTKFAYNPDSELSTTTFPTGTSDEDAYGYDDSDAMSEVTMKKGTETLASLVYTRNKDGEITKATSKGLPGEEKPAFTYDEDSRLGKGAGTKYAYDAANNPTTIGEDTYSYNSADELEKSALKKTTVNTYSYNEVGQRTKTTPASGPATTYGYDQADNLTTVSRPKEGETTAIEDSYAYNGEALRSSQTIAGTTSYLAWDLAEEVPLILNDGSNSYIYGPGGLPMEQISSGGTVTYLHHDQAGSTRLLTGSTGTVTGKCTYSAYGAPTCEGTTSTPLGYDAQYISTDTGLIYLRNRVYEPATAQFLTVDPLEAITGEPYSYVGDDPINENDPLGLCGGTSSWGAFWANCGTDVVNGAGTAANAVGTFVGNHYGQVAEGTAAVACVTEVVGPIGCLALAGGGFGASTYQTVSDKCLSSGQKAAGVLLDALGAVPGAQAAGLEAGGLLGEGAGKTALNVLAGAVGGSAIAGGPAVVSAAASGPSACGCS